MLSSTFELIFMAASNSHVLFCFCNLIIAILLLGSFKPDSEENNNNLNPQMSKRRESIGTSKPKRFHKGLNLDFEVRKMNTASVLSQELCTFPVHNSSAKFEQSHQETTFQCEIVKGDSSWHDTKVVIAKNGSTDDRTMHSAKMRNETNANNAEENDDKEEDELRKRIEEFIEKVNRGWRAEKLGTFYQSQLPV